MTQFIEHNYRYEVKFEMPSLYYRTLTNKVKLHPYGFLSHYSASSLDSKYFDTYDVSCYKDNTTEEDHGDTDRVKVNSHLPKTPWQGKIKVKCKHHVSSRKMPCKTHESLYHLEGSSRTQIPIQAKNWVDKTPQPVQSNRYQRQYSMCQAGIYVTIDTDIQVLPQDSPNTKNFWQIDRLPNTFMLEFKFLAQYFTFISQVVCYSPLRLNRHMNCTIGSGYKNATIGTTPMIHV